MSEPQSASPLDRVTSIKIKLGLLVAVSVTVAAVLATLSDHGGVPPWLAIPVTVLLALGVTQLLATGMTSPLRQMTGATRRMARGDYDVRVVETSSDEVGELARAFNQMAGDLADVDRQRRELVATVAHELRTPLAGLIAVLENLEDGVVPADPEGIRTALAQAERLNQLVTDLLDLSRVQAGVTSLADDRIEVAGFLAGAVQEAGSWGRPVSFDVRVEPVHLAVHGDRARLHQALSNLLDNASRHSPAGSVVRVSAEAGFGEAFWRLEVANPGAGIDPGDRTGIFERFGRLSDPAGGGTGLGLAIARWVTDLHEGRISAVDPVAGESGARFRLDLPVQPRSSGGSAPRPLPTRPEVATSAAARPTPLSDPSAPDRVALGVWPLGSPASRRDVLLGALGVGLLAGLLLPFQAPGLGYVLVLLAGGVVVLVASPNRRNPFTIACATLAALLTSVLMLRAAVWIGVLCALAATALCVAGSARARTMEGILVSGLLWPLSGLHGLPWLGRTIRAFGGVGRWTTVLRTVLLSALAVVVFGLLFASADAIFASWASAVLPDVSLGSGVFRVFVGVAVASLVLATGYFALNPPTVDGAVRSRRAVQRRFEWLAPVVLVDLVFVLFLVSQAAATFGGHEYLRRTTGLTYAEYVHQGFGQLTVATLLTFLVVWAAASKAPTDTVSDRAWLRVALGLLCLLTLVVVGSALHRMDLYQQAYGFSRLRLVVDVFEGWLGLLVLAVLVAGAALKAAWLPRAALLTGATAVLALALTNPDAWIARHNIERYQETGKVDWDYLRGLSDDAVPVLAKIPASRRECALGERAVPAEHLLSWNLGRSRAHAVLSKPVVC